MGNEGRLGLSGRPAGTYRRMVRSKSPAFCPVHARQAPGGRRVSTWHLPGDCMVITRRLPGTCLANAWRLHGDNLATTRRMPGDNLAHAWRPPGDYLAPAWRLPGICAATARGDARHFPIAAFCMERAGGTFGTMSGGSPSVCQIAHEIRLYKPA